MRDVDHLRTISRQIVKLDEILIKFMFQSLLEICKGLMHRQPNSFSSTILLRIFFVET